MYTHEKAVLEMIEKKLRESLHERIVSIYAFGSRVRKDHSEWSDFDILVVVRDREPELEDKIMDIFVEKEMQTGISFTPVIKDLKAFELERRYNTPFYENIVREATKI